MSIGDIQVGDEVMWYCEGWAEICLVRRVLWNTVDIEVVSTGVRTNIKAKMLHPIEGV